MVLITSAYISEIINKLTEKKAYDKISGHSDLKSYIGTKYDLIGLAVPMQRSIFKTGYTFNILSLEDQLSVWNAIWESADVYEVLSQCIYFIEKNWLRFDTNKLWAILRTWVKKIDNWAHSDGLSDIYAHLMEKMPEEIYSQYQVWNKSENPWERRQSLVGMLLYSKKRKTLLPAIKLLDMVEPLITDKDYFVQKGLGWALREIGNVYPYETMAFLSKYCTILHPVAFATAVEKINPEFKNTLKLQRKHKRSLTTSSVKLV
ncbi:DNA alkylation repair protein [Pedobacter foliorum]|uniref:DNA alkylation repair protein n=1 Tax=Pedobacter foliorum TaxID=2739058 RepID=UPI001565468E|nr:DNA alkylation repair protein [Pedobacter foliorum]NRF40147.1 DNA alkylation repair protein [Pedobacter foliorum]